MTKIVGMEDIKSGGELGQELQQGGRDVTKEVLASTMTATRQPG